MSRKNTSPVTKILTFLHCIHHGRSACLCFCTRFFFSLLVTKRFLFRIRHPSGSRLIGVGWVEERNPTIKKSWNTEGHEQKEEHIFLRL
jgi:hypothetical protein